MIPTPQKHPPPKREEPSPPHQCLDLLAVFVPSRRGSLERRFGFQGLERLKGGAISKSISPPPFFVLFSWDGRAEQGPPAAASEALSMSVARGECWPGWQPVASRRRFISGVHRSRSASGFPGLCQVGLRGRRRVGARWRWRKAPPQGSFPRTAKALETPGFL